jgi:ring-1,2-phenylacetyl-CoA epoxidase subunit PaaC
MSAAAVDSKALFRYVLRLGDLSLVLGQRLGEWVGHAPALEEDLGLANIALDLIGQARLLLSYAGEIEGCGRSEDDIAYLREQGEYLNPVLAEQPNGDFGQTIVRQLLIDAFQLELYERMAASTDERLAAIAAKSVKETRYHLRYSGSWLVRLAPRLAEMHTAWTLRLDELLAQATLKRPGDRAHSWQGKRGQHSEHLGYILAEMQYLQRAHPGARW